MPHEQVLSIARCSPLALFLIERIYLCQFWCSVASGPDPCVLQWWNLHWIWIWELAVMQVLAHAEAPAYLHSPHSDGPFPWSSFPNSSSTLQWGLDTSSSTFSFLLPTLVGCFHICTLGFQIFQVYLNCQPPFLTHPANTWAPGVLLSWRGLMEPTFPQPSLSPLCLGYSCPSRTSLLLWPLFPG